MTLRIPTGASRYECTKEGHNKFWVIYRKPGTTEVATWYGAIGSKPRGGKFKSRGKTEKKAEAYVAKERKSKKEKGYVLTEGSMKAMKHATAMKALKAMQTMMPSGKRKAMKATDKPPAKRTKSELLPVGAVKWGRKGGNSEITGGGSLFTHLGGKMSVGALAKSALPSNATWHITYNRVGSPTSLGVGLKGCDLHVDGYQNVFGKDTQSWAVKFEKKFGKPIETFYAAHDGKDKVLKWGGKCEVDEMLAFTFRREDGNKLYVTLPGDTKEVLLSKNLPAQVYAVAATVYNKSTISISAKPGESKLPDRPKHQMDGKPSTSTKPVKPRVEPSAAFAAAVKKIGSGKWGLEMVGRAKVYKREGDLDASKKKEVEYILKSGAYWGDCKTLSDCFDKRHMDDGIITNQIVKSFASSLKLSYWEAGCGGNSFGFLLDVSKRPTFLCDNCDTDITWSGAGIHPAPKAFVKQFSAARYDD